MNKRNIGCCLLVSFILSLSCSCNSKPQFKGGDYKSHMSDFADPIKYNEESPIVDCYFKNIKYTVVKTDVDNKTVTLDVTVPDFAAILKNTIDNNYNENDTIDYDIFLNTVKKELEENLSDSSHPTLNKKIVLSIDKDKNGKWKILQSDEFDDFISESIYKSLEET